MDIAKVNPTPKQLLDKPDERWQVSQNNQVLASASIWFNSNHSIDNAKAGLIGHFHSMDHSASIKLIDFCCRELKSKNCIWAIAPMDGSTWKNYRFKTSNNDQTPFLLEPSNPIEWPNSFKQAGFVNLATYYSLLAKNINFIDPRNEKILYKLSKYNLKLRKIDKSNIESEIDRIYQFSIRSFANNLFYTKIDFEEFYNLYKPFLSLLDPDLILLLEEENNIVGYIFSIREENHVVVKTIALDPNRKYTGLGIYLLEESHKIIKNKGFKTVIHALMHEKNPSFLYTKKIANTYAEYELLSKKL